MKQIVVLAEVGDPHLKELNVINDWANVTICNTEEALKKDIDQAEILLLWEPRFFKLLKPAFPQATSLKWIHTRSAGVDSNLFPELVDSHVILTNSKGIYSASLSEFVIAAILFFAKGFRRMLRSQQAHIWDPFKVTDVCGQTLGIVGLGDIGKTIASRAHCLGLRVIGCKQNINEALGCDHIEQLYAPDHLLEMLKQCDYVVICAPLTRATRGMIDEPALRTMKPNGVIINIGRGPVVQEAALIRALREGWIKGAALDVFSEEPLPPDSPLFELENLLLSPHCADITENVFWPAVRLFVTNFMRYMNGEPLFNIVDKRAGY
jgi:phosphoglycerate dehydrogenase-like enzyme